MDAVCACVECTQEMVQGLGLGASSACIESTQVEVEGWRADAASECIKRTGNVRSRLAHIQKQFTGGTSRTTAH